MHLFLSMMLIFALTGCQSAYYATMEQVGVHKRDIMADRVEAASLSQQQASNQFASALDALQSITPLASGKLDEMYSRINNEYKNSQSAVNNVHKRINAVKNVSEALFAEWREELALYSSNKLRLNSEQRLKNTERSYQKMITAMEKSENKMKPILNTLRDNTLYLKHNLNAAAISALKNEFADLKIEINQAIKNMQVAIAESDRFLATLKK